MCSCATWTAARRGRPGTSRAAIEPDDYEVTFSEARADFVRRDGDLTTTMDVVVSAECDAEVRRVCVSNLGDRVRTIELTSYAEIVLAPPAADDAHPAFSKLFVQTEYVPEIGVILATRRRRSPAEPEAWAAHLVVVEGTRTASCSSRRIAHVSSDARGSCARPSRSRTAASCRAATAPCSTRSSACAAACGWRPARRCAWRSGRWSHRRVARCSTSRTSTATRAAFDRAATLAWTQGQVELHHLGIASGRGDCSSSASPVTCSTAIRRCGRRPTRSVAATAGSRCSGRMAFPATCRSCWCGSTTRTISGIVRQLLRAFEYWRLKRLSVDLVILNERASSYVQDLQMALETLIAYRPVSTRHPRRSRRAAASSSSAPTSSRVERG